MMFQRAAEHASIVAAWRSQPTCATRRCKELGSEAVEEGGGGAGGGDGGGGDGVGG